LAVDGRRARPYTVRVKSAAVFALVGLALAVAGCREGELCIRTISAVCTCDDPLLPDVKTCVAYADTATCRGDAGIDPCEVEPCCLAPVDGGRRDMRDGQADASPVMDGAVEASVPDASSVD
jgi:hypothetical protein